MTDGPDSPQAEYQVDEQLVRVLRERLLPDVQAAVRAGIAEELSTRPEQPMPLYYDRFISAEIRRLDESIAHVGERIDALKEYVDQRFDEVDQRFDAVDQHFTLMDQHFTLVDQHFDEQRTYVDQRFTSVDQHFDDLERRLIALDQRLRDQRDEILRHVDRSDMWTRALFGVVLAMMTAVLVKLFFP
jgi:flagellar capping protein FliD